MGMSFSPMYQPVSTASIKADGDLDLGQYDLYATNIECSTAEAAEFVGGVGNFTSGLFSGGVDVSGILHAENALQVDGNLTLEGAINNVNISDNGEITTSQGINAANFNGVPIKSSGTITVTPQNTLAGYIPFTSTTYQDNGCMLLNYNPNTRYTGSLKFRCTGGVSDNGTFYYCDGTFNQAQEVVITKNTDYTLTLNNSLYLWCGWRRGEIQFYNFTLT